MKTANKLRLLGMLACCLIGQSIFAQSPIVKDIDVQADQTQLIMNETAASTYLVQISGPNAYHTQFEVANTSDIRLSPQKADGTAFSNGSYKVSITPTFQLSAEHQQNMMEMRQKGDTEAINQYLIDHQLPTSLDVYTINFGVQDGKFVAPGRHEGDMPPPTMFGKNTDFRSSDAIYASVNYFETDIYAQTIDNSLLEEDMQIFATDVIVQGSLCVGIDCNSSESFGFDTQRFKENNLRVHFDDTSASASFPSNDWRIAINDSDNGGSNYFAVQDASGGTTPFRVEAGAGNNALHVDASGGNIGMGTASPVVELHVTDGDSPTMRLEQNGANGFTPQTWDIAGNETNFFVRNVTSGSHLSFRILAGSGTDDAIVIAGDGQVGIGTDNPSAELHVKQGNLFLEDGNLQVQGNTTSKGTNTRFFVDNAFNVLNNANNNTILHVNGATERVGIGIVSPDHLLQLGVDDAVKPNGGTWAAPSDRRLKTNIRDFEDGLAKVMAIRPVRYNYNGKMNMPTEPEFIGLIAQEIQEVAPYTVKVTEGSEEGYLFVDGTPLTYILINAVQDQQAIIDNQDERINELEAQLSEVAQLRQEVAELAKVLKAQVTEQNADTQNQNVSEKR